MLANRLGLPDFEEVQSGPASPTASSVESLRLSRDWQVVRGSGGASSHKRHHKRYLNRAGVSEASPLCTSSKAQTETVCVLTPPRALNRLS